MSLTVKTTWSMLSIFIDLPSASNFRHTMIRCKQTFTFLIWWNLTLSPVESSTESKCSLRTSLGFPLKARGNDGKQQKRNFYPGVSRTNQLTIEFDAAAWHILTRSRQSDRRPHPSHANSSPTT